MMFCKYCKKEVFKGFFEIKGDEIIYYHESCKKNQVLDFFKELHNEDLDKLK